MENIIIIGSGVGGATIAKELAGRGKRVRVLEKGPLVKELGSAKIVNYYDENVKRQSKEGTLIHSAFMAGGAGVVSCANGVRVLEKELKQIGVDLDEYFLEVEDELGIMSVPYSHIGPRTEKIMQAAKELNYDIQPMPKFINFDKCVKCGMCVLGCAYGAKWSPLDYIEQAQKTGVEFIYETCVEEILSSGGKVSGIRAFGPQGEMMLEADTIILSAGGIGTPIILQKSGIKEAGGSLFVDLYVNTYGQLKDSAMGPEIPMSAHISDFYHSKGFLMAPYMPPLPAILFIPPFLEKSRLLHQKDSIGIMVKINDESTGKVNVDGSIDKPVTEKDRKKIEDGVKVSKEILLKLGCEESSIFTTNVESAHPGGTAAIGTVVNTDFETSIKGLYVSDASVLPESPGAPPIVTIIALAKRLAHTLINQ